MRALIALIVEAILNWFWKIGLEAHKKHMKIKTQKKDAENRADIVQLEINVYKDIVQEALESDIEPEVIDEILIDASRGFLRRLERLQTEPTKPAQD